MIAYECCRTCAVRIPNIRRKGLDPEIDAVIKMKPSEFLSLTARPPVCEVQPFDAEKINDWDEWPFLIIDPETGQVHGYEGKHRVAAMEKSGIAYFEVHIQITPDPARFNCDMRAMLEWRWNGVLPPLSDCVPIPQRELNE